MKLVKKCNHRYDMPIDNIHKVILCGYYSEIKRKDGIHNAHYPECKKENCPLIYPELLEKWIG